jgi:hypothetical protein
MEEGQTERDCSPDEERYIIDDGDMFVDGDGDYGEETCED